MKCKSIQNKLLDLLPLSSNENIPIEIETHLQECKECKLYLKETEQAINSIKPIHSITIPSDLHKNVMSTLHKAENQSVLNHSRWNTKIQWRPAYAFTFAIVIFLCFSFSDMINFFAKSFINDSILPAEIQLSQVWANEFSSFQRTGTIHVVNRILAEPMEKEYWATERWFPICGLTETGNIQTYKISLEKQPNTQYDIKDEILYDFTHQTFLRTLSINQKILFINAFDGDYIYISDYTVKNKPRITNHSTPRDFTLPNPEEFLGLLTGFPAFLNEHDNVITVNNGTETLSNGINILRIKSTVQKDNDITNQFYFSIDSNTNKITEIKNYIYGNPLLTFYPEISSDSSDSSIVFDFNNIELDLKTVNDIEVQEIIAQPTMVVTSKPVLDIKTLEQISEYFSPLEYTKTIMLFDWNSPSNPMYLHQYRNEKEESILILQSHSLSSRYGKKLKNYSELIESTPTDFSIYKSTILDQAAGMVFNILKLTDTHNSERIHSGYLFSFSPDRYLILATQSNL